MKAKKRMIKKWNKLVKEYKEDEKINLNYSVFVLEQLFRISLQSNEYTANILQEKIREKI